MKSVAPATKRLLPLTVRPGDAAAYYGYRSLPGVCRSQGRDRLS